MSTIASPSGASPSGSPSRQLPEWLSPASAGIAGLVIAGIIGLLSPNFGAGAIFAGLACLVFAALSLGLIAINRDRAARIGYIVTASILAVLGIVALLANSAAYQYSITRAEAQGNYQSAIKLMTSANQSPPYSTSLAEAYLNWGDAELSAKAYDQAEKHLLYVVQNFPTLTQAAQANGKLPGLILTWARYAVNQNDTITAGQQYDLLVTKYAQSSEAASASTEAPPAFLAWGDSLAAKGFYADAYKAYQLIEKMYPKNAVATTEHAHAATCLSNWAKALSDAHRYNEAGPLYTTLAKSYGDTAEGKQAQKLLNQGVQVIGRLLKADGATPVLAYTTVRLSSQWTVTGNTYSAGGNQFLADTDANGYFEFPAVPAGQYLLEWRSTSGPFLTLSDGSKLLEIITVQPLQNLELPIIITNSK
jgi:tetratricopeptide (TPR) repeat protein